jgi:hypothetical protein
MKRRYLPLILVLLVAGIDYPARAQSASASIDAKLLAGLRYRMVGPSRGGRVTAVAGHRKHPGTFYQGTSGGGVFKTTDYGLTWLPVSDGFFETGSIGSIEVAESNPQIVYVGTGSDGIRSNVIVGRGLYRSNDAGKTWVHAGLRDTGQIAKLRVHPQDPETIYAAAQGLPWAPNVERGVYRSNDGGKTWKKVLYVNDTLGASAVAMNPANPKELYASLWFGQRKPWSIARASTRPSMAAKPGPSSRPVCPPGSSARSISRCRRRIRSGCTPSSKPQERNGLCIGRTMREPPGPVSRTSRVSCAGPSTTPTSTPIRRTPTRFS